MMRWKDGRIFTSQILTGGCSGVEEIDDGIWSLYYGSVLLALCTWCVFVTYVPGRTQLGWRVE